MPELLMQVGEDVWSINPTKKDIFLQDYPEAVEVQKPQPVEVEKPQAMDYAEGRQQLTYYTPDGQAHRIKGDQKDLFLQAFPDAMTLEEVQKKQAEYKAALTEQKAKEKKRLEDIAKHKEEVGDIVNYDDFKWNQEINGLTYDKGSDSYYDKEGNKVDVSPGLDGLPPGIEPGSVEATKYKNRLNHATGLAVKEANRIEENLGELLRPELVDKKGWATTNLAGWFNDREVIDNDYYEEGDSAVWNLWGVGSGNKLANKNFDPETGVLTSQGKELLATQLGIDPETGEPYTPDSIPVEKLEEIQNDFATLNDIQAKVNDDIVTRYEISEVDDNLVETIQGKRGQITTLDNQISSLEGEISRIPGVDDGTISPTDKIKLGGLQDKLATAQKNRSELELKEEDYSAEEWKNIERLLELEEGEGVKVEGTDEWEDGVGIKGLVGSYYNSLNDNKVLDQKVTLPGEDYGKTKTIGKDQATKSGLRFDDKGALVNNEVTRHPGFAKANAQFMQQNAEEINRLSKLYDLTPEELFKQIQKGNVQADTFLKNKYKDVDQAFREDLERKDFVRGTWSGMYQKAVKEGTSEEVLGEEIVNIKATASAKDQASEILGEYAQFAHLSDEQKFDKTNQAYETMLFDDPVVKNQYESIVKDSIAPLEKYRNELISDPNYDPKDDDQVIKVNQLLMDRQRELTIGRLYEDPTFQKRSAAIGVAIAEVTDGYEYAFGRQNSRFLSTMDALRGIDGEGGWLPFNDSLADLIEGVESGVEGIQVSIGDKAKGSWHGNQFRRAEKKQGQLEDLIEQGFSPEDKVKWDLIEGKYVKSEDGKTIQERLDGYKEDVSYHQAEVVEQIEDMMESEEYLSYFKQANFEDGIGFEDVFLTVGQALPHIGMAAGGTALAAATGGTALAALAPILTYAGTAMMGLQMYGDNYWGAIEQNMKDKGLDKESLAKNNPELSATEIDELWKQEAIANLESGEGANMATSAAYAGAQTLLESYGANQMVEGTIDAIKGVKGARGLAAGSLFKSSWDDVGQWMLRGAIEKGGNALEEFGTEYMQEILGQVSAATQTGKDYDALIDTSAALQAGIGGAITGFALPFAGTVYNQTKTQIRNSAGEAALKFRPGSKFAKRFEMADQYFNDSKDALDNEYSDMDKNPKRKAEYYDKLNTLNNVRNANIKLRGQDYLADMSQDQYKNLMDTYIDIQDYDQQIEKARKSKDKVLEKNLRAEQNVLIDKASEIVKAERTTANVSRIMEDLGKTKEMTVVDSEADLEAEAKKRNVALDDKSKTVGFYDPNTGEFVVAKEMAANLQEGNTAGHELLHKMLFNTLYEVDGEGNIQGKNVARGLASALDEVLAELDPADVADSKFQKKLQLYKKDPAAYRAEEKIALFGDAIESGDLKFNESIFTKIGDQIRRFLQAAGLKDIKFNSGRDVYNFLKDYNASVSKGKLNKAQKKMMAEGAEVGSDIRRFQGTEGKLGKATQFQANKAMLGEDFTDDSYEQTNRLLEDPDIDLENSFDQKRALKIAAPVIEATTQRLWDPKSLLTRDEFKKTLEKEYLDSLQEYDADRDTGMNAGKSISNKFNLRAAKVAKDNIGKVEAESLDSDQAKQTVDTTEQKDFDAPVAKQDKARAKKYPSSLRTVKENIPESSKKSLIGGVDATTGKTTGVAKNIIQGVGQNANPESVAKSIIASTKDKSVMKQMRKDVGKFGTDKYNKFVDKTVDEGLTKTIPAATIKRRLGRKANVESGLIDYEQTGTTPTKKITAEGKRTDFNKPVYKINKVDNTKLKEYYKAGEKRQQSLFSMLAEGMIVEGLADLKNDKAFMQKLQDTLDLKGVEMTADQYMSDLENSLDQRTKEDTSLDTVKANKALKKDIYKDFAERTWAEDLQKSKDNINTQFGAGTVATIKPNTKWETFKKRQIEKGIDWDGQIAANDETRMQRDFEAVQRDLKKQQKEAKGREFRKTAPRDKFGNIDTARIEAARKAKANKALIQKRAKDARTESTQFVIDKDLKPLGTAQKFERGKTPKRKHERLTAEEKVIRDDYIKRNFKKLGPNFITSSIGLTNTRTGLFANMDEVYAAIGDGDIDKGKALVEAETTEYNEKAEKLVNKKENKAKFDKDPNHLVEQKRGVDLVYLNKDGKVVKSVLGTAMNEQAGDKTKNQDGSYKKWTLETWDKNVKDPNWRKLQRDKLRVLKNIGKVMEADLAVNPENILGWQGFLSAQDNQTTHPIKALAPITFFSTQMFKDSSKLRAEHTLPSNQVATMLLGMAQRGEVDSEFGFIDKNYFQGKLTVEDDKKLKGGEFNYTEDMPQSFYEVRALDPSTWERYTNKEVNAENSQGGINLNTYETYDPNTGKIMTIAESLGVGLTEAQYTMPDGSLNTNLIQQQNNTIYDMLTKGEPSAAQAKATLTSKANIETQQAKTLQTRKEAKMNKGIFKENTTASSQKQTMLNSQETAAKANKTLNKKRKGISVFDLDGTLANTKERVVVKMPDGTIQKLNALEFAEQADILTEQGAEFDFSEFTDVKGAKKGPLADLALKRQNKFGSGDIYVLTARPQASAQNIKLFLDSIGLNIPIENITGLEDGSPQAKADWVLAKTSEGYNDFYFADDSQMNVEAVDQILSQVDVKSKVQIAKANKAVELDKEFNQMLEETTGLKAGAEYSRVRAKLEGKKKDKGVLNWLIKQISISASAEDFMGLMYDLVGKAEKGIKHLKWIKEKLMDPYNKAEMQILSAKVAVANDFAALKKKFPSLRSKAGNNPLLDLIGVGPFTKSHAVRVYNWVKQGIDMTQHGMSKRDIDALMKAVENDNELRVFADEVGLIQKEAQYPPPGKDWQGGDIATDITNSLEKGFRRKAMVEFDENVKIIFSDKNLYKLEGLFGSKWVEALKDSLRRMKSGSNRPVYTGGGSRIVNSMLDWLNGSVGAIMFLNMRSGLLQLISNVNFINWGDNNMVAAAKAFASKAYIPTVLKLLNSDYLVNRRDGLRINVNEAELANAAKEGGVKGMIAYLLDKGFVITRVMDSLAIATGGATFFINRKAALLKRINKETGKLYTEAEAEAQAFEDFYAIAEESQQSSNPSKISQQQASIAGRVILSFQNVTMQYNRLTKKAIRDLVNRRRGPGQTQREADLGNMSKIVYYMGVQNVLFHSLQKLLFAGLFDDEEDKKTKDKTAEVANGMLDSILFGLGFGGAGIATIKNVALEIMLQNQKKSPKYEEAVWKLFDFSPVLDNKVRKMRAGLKTFSWNREEIRKRGWSLENPAYFAISQIIAAGTNIPIDRVLRKYMSLRTAVDEETKNWHKIALILGWDSYSLGLPYWGLESTIKREAVEREKAKVQYKQDIKKLKRMGYKKGKDNGPDVIEVEHFSGIIQYWSK